MDQSILIYDSIYSIIKWINLFEVLKMDCYNFFLQA